MTGYPTLELNETFEWQGANVRWAKFGSGPPVVLCHGTPWSSYVWRRTVEAIQAERTVYVWDMLGYGQSEKPDSDVSLKAQGQILARLIAFWGLDRPDLVAHDYGGAVALRAHLLHAIEMRSLLLADVVALRPWGSPFFRLVSEHADVFEALPSKLHEALLREYISGASAVGLSSDVLDQLARPWLGDGQAAFYRQVAQADEKFTDEVQELYESIRVPTLIVWGTADTWIPADRAEQLVKLIPNSALQLIEGAGHLVQEDQPARFAEVVSSWLSEHVGV